MLHVAIGKVEIGPITYFLEKQLRLFFSIYKEELCVTVAKNTFDKHEKK